MKYVGWASNVNRIIIDSCQITIGENALQKDSLENGKEKTRLSSSIPPKKFQVTMDFDWLEKDKNGLTEKDRFLNWYQYVLQYGANCFQFPSILLGENKKVYEWYRITSAVQGGKSGYSVRFTMTWESTFEGTITIPESEISLDKIGVHKSYIDVIFSDTPVTYPSMNDVIINVDSNIVVPLSMTTQDNVARFYIPDMEPGSRNVVVTVYGTAFSQVINVE